MNWLTGFAPPTYHETVANWNSLSLAQQSLTDAADAMKKTIDRIRGLEGDPLELIQSLQAMANSRDNYLNASVDYNVAQLQLLRAIGNPRQEVARIGLV